MFHKLRIGLADAGGVVHFVASNQQRHCHAVVVVGTVFAHSAQAVGLFDW